MKAVIKFKTLKPFANRILIKRTEPITKSKGGILLTVQEEQYYGKVLETGPGTTYDNGNIRPCLVKKGDTVLLPQYSGLKITMGDGEDYWVYRDEDITGVLEEPI